MLTIPDSAGGAAAPVATPTPAGPQYNVIVVGPFSQRYRFGLGLNNEGHVTGQTTGSQAFLYDGRLHLLGKPAGAKFSVGQGISDTDSIAATAQQGSIRHAYAVIYPQGHVTWVRLAGLPGFAGSEAEAVLPDGSAIAGALCATGDPACSHSGQHPLPVVWSRTGKGWSLPRVLDIGKGPSVGTVTGIARAGAITVVAGGVNALTANGAAAGVLWLLPGHQYFPLKGQGRYVVTAASAVAHGSGNVFYVAGTIATRYEGTYGEPAMWTVRCTRTSCTQTNLQVIASLGETYGVNSHGTVIGYDRSGGDAGSNFIWQAGRETLSAEVGHAINNSGQMVGWRFYPPGSHRAQIVFLQPIQHQPP